MPGMKLSEAIRLGAMLGPQCHGPYIQVNRTTLATLMGYPVIERVECATCAMGAALLAVGRRDLLGLTPDYVNPQSVFPDLDRYVDCAPIGRSGNIYNIIVFLNDRLFWTREQIADWVRTVEETDQVTESEAETRELVTA